MPGHCDSVFVRSNIRVRPVLRLLQVGGKFKECKILATRQIFRGNGGMPRKVFFKHLDLRQKNDEKQVDNNRNPSSFPATRTREIVLQLDEQMRYTGIIIKVFVGRFPFLSVVEPQLFGLWLLGRCHWILEWNLRNRHELNLSVLRSVG